MATKQRLSRVSTNADLGKSSATVKRGAKTVKSVQASSKQNAKAASATKQKGKPTGTLKKPVSSEIEPTTQNTSAQAALSESVEREIRERLATLARIASDVASAGEKLQAALATLNDSASRLATSLSLVANAVEVAQRPAQAPAADKIATHLAGIEARLERFKVDNRHGLDLIGLKLEQVVNGLADLRRTISSLGARPTSPSSIA